MAALSRAVIGANSALASALGSAEGQGGGRARLGAVEVKSTLAIAAGMLEGIAAALLTLLADSLALAERPAGIEASREDQSFAYLVCASGAAILDSGSRVCASLESSLTNAHVCNHIRAIRLLVKCLSAMEVAQPGALKVLRATTCSPDAVVTCLRRHFLQYRGGGQGTEGQPAAGPPLPSAALEASAISVPFLSGRRHVPKPGRPRRRQLRCGGYNYGPRDDTVCGRACCHQNRR